MKRRTLEETVVTEIARLQAVNAGLLAACEKLVHSHCWHGPCRNNNCRDCDAAYKQGLAAIVLAKKD